MGAIAFQIISLTIVFSTVYSGADKRNHQCAASLAFMSWNHRGPVNSPHKWPVASKMFPFYHGLNHLRYVSDFRLLWHIWYIFQIRKLKSLTGIFSWSIGVEVWKLHKSGTARASYTWCMPGSLTSGFLWSRRRGKRSQHYRRMHNPQFSVSGKMSIAFIPFPTAPFIDTY